MKRFFSLFFLMTTAAGADDKIPTLDYFETPAIPLDGSDAPGITNHWLWAQADGRFGKGILNMGLVRAGAGPEREGTMVVRIDGMELVASGTADWRPNQVTRYAAVNGIEATGKVRAADRKYALLNVLELHNVSGQQRRFELSFTFAGHTPLQALVETSEPVFPNLVLEPGEMKTFRAVSLLRGTERGLDGLRNDFEAEWEAADRYWNAVIEDAFTPGAGLFLSGGMENRTFENAELTRLYRFGIVTALMCLKNDPDRRTPFNWYGTSMPDAIYGVESFIWDVGYASKTLAKLDPSALRNVIEHWAMEGVHGRLCVPYHREASILGPRFYAASGSLFTWSILNYLEATNDYPWLDRDVRGKTIWESLLSVDEWHESRPKWNGLSHYGEEMNLFDDKTVLGYHHYVAGPNAAAVWIKRRIADFAESHREDSDLANRLRLEADQLAAAVIGNLYQAEGDHAGTWRQRHQNGAFANLRHGWDFMNVGTFLAEDLRPAQRQQMRDWFVNHLASPAPGAIWMVTQDPRDGNNGTHQMEHNGRGAYPAWPFHSAWALRELGFPEDARRLTRQIAPITKWGAISQGNDGVTGRRCRSGWASVAGATMATLVMEIHAFENSKKRQK